MVGIIDVYWDICGIWVIGVWDIEVILYMLLFIFLFLKYYIDIKIFEEIIII